MNYLGITEKKRLYTDSVSVVAQEFTVSKKPEIHKNHLINKFGLKDNTRYIMLCANAINYSVDGIRTFMPLYVSFSIAINKENVADKIFAVDENIISEEHFWNEMNKQQELQTIKQEFISHIEKISLNSKVSKAEPGIEEKSSTLKI